MKEIRLEARLRNNILWHLIFDSCESVAEFCRRHEITNESLVCELLNLKTSPVNADGEYRKVCQRLAEIAKVLMEDLFPLHLYQMSGTKMAKEFSLRELAAGRQREMLLIPAETTPYEAAVNRELAERLDDILATLTPREEQVLRRRFGLPFTQREADLRDFCDLSPFSEEQTAEQVAEEFGLSRSYILKIEAEALRKLRRPRRLNRLKPFVEE